MAQSICHCRFNVKTLQQSKLKTSKSNILATNHNHTNNNNNNNIITTERNKRRTIHKPFFFNIVCILLFLGSSIGGAEPNCFDKTPPHSRPRQHRRVVTDMSSASQSLSSLLPLRHLTSRQPRRLRQCTEYRMAFGSLASTLTLTSTRKHTCQIQHQRRHGHGHGHGWIVGTSVSVGRVTFPITCPCRMLSNRNDNLENGENEEDTGNDANSRTRDNRQLANALLEMTLSRATSTLGGNVIGGGIDDSVRMDPYAGRNVDNYGNTALDIDWERIRNDGDDDDKNNNDDDDDVGGDSVQNLVNVAYNRASSVLTNNPSENSMPDQHNNNNSNEKGHPKSYLANPSVTPTALAHSLWKQVIRPYSDLVIDATCGNGKDSLILASMLFPPNDDTNNYYYKEEEDEEEYKPSSAASPRLMCIDIQKRACQNTRTALSTLLPSTILRQNVYIFNGSHAPLPDPYPTKSSLPPTSQKAGLICYNLGYLPGTSQKESFTTQMATTIHSLTDSALNLRVGGLLSVLTYPGTSIEEADAVRYFCEGLAMLTTRNEGGWRGYLDSIPGNENDNGGVTVKQVVKVALERVVSEGDEKQTWRVFDHRPLGRPLSPILVTATRIK